MRAPILIVSLLLLAACEDKVPDTLEKYRLRLMNFDRTIEMAELPTANEASTLHLNAPLDPPVTVTGDARGNTDILPIEHFANIDHSPPGDLHYPSLLEKGFHWISPFYSFSDEEKKAPGATIVSELDAMLARKYVVVYRTIERVAPEPQAGGRLDLDAFLLEAATGKPLRHVRILAMTPPGASADDLSATAHDSLLDALEDATGAKIEIARKRKNPPPANAASPLLAGLPADDPNAPKPLINGGSAEAIVAANVEYAKQLTAKHISTANVCRSVLIMSRLNKLPPDLMAEARSACVGPSQ